MIRLLAPAKVNLDLHILGAREDGYHEITSVVQKISLFDRITLKEEERPGIRLECGRPDIPSGPENLAHRAASLLMEEAGLSDRGVSIALEKNIPHGAGLGGGSSDAAAVLLGLCDLFGLSLEPGRLHGLASRIGSDVPLFLHPSPSLVSGRGDLVNRSPLWLDAHFLVVFPGFRVSTQWAYSNFRLTKKTCNYTISTQKKADRGKIVPHRWPDLLVNDLEAVVLDRHPEISRCKEDLVRFGARASLMSGSGSAVFGLFEDPSAAKNALKEILSGGWPFAVVAKPVFS